LRALDRFSCGSFGVWFRLRIRAPEGEVVVWSLLPLVTLDLVCRLSIWWRAGFGAEVGLCEVIGLCLVPLTVVGLLCLFGV
jgi:hypothetical protein